MTEWLMESLRKDANRGGSAPWETGSGKAVCGTHQTVAFDRAWWGRVPDATPLLLRKLASQLLVTLRNRAKKLKGFLFGKRQFY
ncbi:hypothetical protein HU200_010484 [Digitaria exilis]|uniref:Uncharacterized protein n=1 Tax=Digitaria exilis TaxID=1010633 RepID=A0A835FIM1_9POAL|nr:hypothetical protein HU200_010484 [Digitaria exilis]